MIWVTGVVGLAQIRDLDLNLLRVFDCVFRTRRVVDAAELLEVSQPAVSNALRKLRSIFDDELFIRTSKGMVPTQKAMDMAEPIGFALKTIGLTLDSSDRGYDPSVDQRQFIIATSDLGESYFGPRLVTQFMKWAPNVTLDFVRNNRPNIGDLLEDGEVDIVLGYLPDLITNMFSFRLFYQNWNLSARKDHPIFSKPATLEDLRACQWIGVRSVGSGLASVNSELLKMGLVRNIEVWCPNFGTIAPIIACSDLIGCVPERWSTVYQEAFGLKSIPFPIALPKHSINAIWHARVQNDPANQWLRQQISMLFRDN